MNAVEVDSLFPLMDASSAVDPTVRITANILYLAFYLPGCRDSAVVRFAGVTSWSFGYPNDEGLAEHPFWGKGITFYNFHRCIDGPTDLGSHRWIATFHDGTFEVTAAGVEIVTSCQPATDPTSALTSVLGSGEGRLLSEYYV
jgi:hypothetical protein